jgi:uncharacterized protein (DUF433 family)
VPGVERGIDAIGSRINGAVRGTRIPVSVILDCLAAGLGEDEILQQYRTLNVEGVRAAAAYGAALARERSTDKLPLMRAGISPKITGRSGAG